MTRTSIRPRACRIMAATVAAVGAISAMPAGASAGGYEVRACDAVSGGANNSWSVQRTAPEAELTAFTKCATVTADPYGDMQQGIGVFDNFVTGSVPADGRYAEQRFTAPTGTRITAAEIVRDNGNRGMWWRNYGRIDSVDRPTETCFPVSGEAFCRISGLKAFTGLNAQTIAYGARCENSDGGCTNGFTLHEVWAIVRSAVITLDDTEAPAVSTPTATGLADGAWHRGAGTITFTATDNTGIRVRRLLEGSTTRATATAPGSAAGGCGTLNAGDAYTYLQPCAGARGLNGVQAVSVADVCAWGDGEHTIRAEAEDTGGTRTASAGSVTVRVDCTGPIVTAGPAGEQAVSAGQSIEPVVHASDPRSVASTEIEWQDNQMGYWEPYTGPITAQQNRAYRFRARATDTVGNTSAWSQPSAWTSAVHVGPAGDPVPDTGTPTGDQGGVTAPEDHGDGDEGSLTETVLLSAPEEKLRAAVRTPKARVSSARFNRRARTFTIAGRVTGAEAAQVVVRLRVTVGKRVRSLTRRVTVRKGRFRAAIRLPRRTTKARLQTVSPATRS